MTGKVKIAGSLLVMGLMSATMVAAEEPKYNCELLVLKTPSETAHVEAAQASGGGGAFMVSGVLSIAWGDSTFTSDGPHLRWNGVELIPPFGEGTPEPGKSVRILAMPRVTTRRGGGGVQVKVGGQESLEYFEGEPDGRFALRIMDIAPLIELSFTLAKTTTPDALRVNWRYNLVQTGERKALQGVSLNVGPPEMHRASGEFKGDLRIGNWCLLAFGESTRLAVFVKILPSRD